MQERNWFYSLVWALTWHFATDSPHKLIWSWSGPIYGMNSLCHVTNQCSASKSVQRFGRPYFYCPVEVIHWEWEWARDRALQIGTQLRWEQNLLLNWWRCDKGKGRYLPPFHPGPQLQRYKLISKKSIWSMDFHGGEEHALEVHCPSKKRGGIITRRILWPQ